MKSLPKNHTRYVVFDDIHDNTKLSGAMSNAIRKFVVERDVAQR